MIITIHARTRAIISVRYCIVFEYRQYRFRASYTGETALHCGHVNVAPLGHLDEHFFCVLRPRIEIQNHIDHPPWTLVLIVAVEQRDWLLAAALTVTMRPANARQRH